MTNFWIVFYAHSRFLCFELCSMNKFQDCFALLRHLHSSLVVLDCFFFKTNIYIELEVKLFNIMVFEDEGMSCNRSILSSTFSSFYWVEDECAPT